MRDGQLADGAAVLRAKIDMASPNINMRDPALYRIRRATHHNTGDKWCIYPMYTFAHPIEDALEQITHSICTLEFEDQRPFYDWLLDRLAEGGLIASPHPRQYEFARLNLTYVITSKRKLRQLVEEGHVDGWDDPRMPTLAGLRRRGYTPEALKLFCERIGVTKSGGWIDYASLEAALRDTLDPIAPRAMAVLDPVKLVITNWDELMGGDDVLDDCTAPVHPHHPEMGRRALQARPRGLDRAHRLRRRAAQGLLPPVPRQQGAAEVRPRHRVHRRHEGRRRQAGRSAGHGWCPTPRAARRARTRSRSRATSPGWRRRMRCRPKCGCTSGCLRPSSRASGELLDELNRDSLVTATAFVEPSLASAAAGERGAFQFERHGYFVLDAKADAPGKRVFNRAAGMKDSWGK